MFCNWNNSAKWHTFLKCFRWPNFAFFTEKMFWSKILPSFTTNSIYRNPLHSLSTELAVESYSMEKRFPSTDQIKCLSVYIITNLWLFRILQLQVYCTATGNIVTARLELRSSCSRRTDHYPRSWRRIAFSWHQSTTEQSHTHKHTLSAHGNNTR